MKFYLSYEFFSYDRHDRYNDMETKLKPASCFCNQIAVITVTSGLDT